MSKNAGGIENWVDVHSQSFRASLSRRLARDPRLIFDLCIGFFVLLITEGVLTFARASIFMFQNKFWDYEFLAFSTALSIPSIIIFVLALFVGACLFWFIFSPNNPDRIDRYVNWFLSGTLVLLGLILTTVLATATGALLMIEMILLSLAYFSRFATEKRSVGIVFSIFFCFCLILTTLYSGFQGSRAYERLLGNVGLSAWNVSLVNVNSVKQEEGCVVLLAPSTVWIRDAENEGFPPKAFPRSQHNIRYLERNCN